VQSFARFRLAPVHNSWNGFPKHFVPQQTAPPGFVGFLASPDPKERLIFRFLTALTLVTLTALVLAHSSPPAYAATDWEQVGVDIDGEANRNQSGYSVSLSNDGSIVAVGEWRTAW